MSNKLISLRRDLDHIRIHRVDIRAQRSRLATRLSKLNREVRAKKISYEIYESKFKYLLGGKTAEAKKKYFKKRLEAIKHREKDLLSRIKHEIHANKRRTKTIAIAAAMLILFLPIMTFTTFDITGFATYNDTSIAGKAVIPSYYAIDMSTEINQGILFGDLVGSTYVVVPGTQYENATKSYTGANSIPEYYVTLSSNSNTNVKTCIKSVDWSGPASLGVGSINWGSKIGPTATLPATPGTTMTTSFDQTQALILPGESEHYRFWLTTSAGQVAGAYNTTTTFKAIDTGSNC